MIGPVSSLERTAFWLMAACLALTQIKLLAAQVLFGVVALIWLTLVVRERQMRVPAFFWPLVAYGALTFVSAAIADRNASPSTEFDPWTSLKDCKQLVLFLMVPVVARLARGDRAMTALNVIIAVGAAGAIVGVIQYAMGAVDLNNRPDGTLSHYMTYGGVLMLTLSAAVARLLFYPAELIWPAIAVPALSVALFATQARNAWIGAGGAITVLLAMRRLRLVLIMPVLLAIFLVVAPASLRNRMLSIFDPNDLSSRDRFAMLEMGRRIVRDHPVVGVGPDRVRVVYPQYRPANAVNPTNPHLHNVPVHIAAERGLPALAVWMIFIAVAALDLFRQLRDGPAKPIAGAGLAAIVAMLGAGMFEYNFGDSEFLMLFLGLITLPFAARMTRRGSDEPDAPVAVPANRPPRPSELKAHAE
jgi:hypothetical protein